MLARSSRYCTPFCHEVFDVAQYPSLSLFLADLQYSIDVETQDSKRRKNTMFGGWCKRYRAGAEQHNRHHSMWNGLKEDDIGSLYHRRRLQDYTRSTLLRSAKGIKALKAAPKAWYRCSMAELSRNFPSSLLRKKPEKVRDSNLYSEHDNQLRDDSKYSSRAEASDHH